MTREALVQEIFRKKSFLCVGLDPDLQKIPQHLLQLEDPIFEFNKQIIDATQHLCVAYKPNLAFYELYGASGWESLRKTIEYIPREHLVIADAKRGDIGNTARKYASAFFEQLNCDALTVAPYMGQDSVEPFLEYPNKWVILLALTSNPGAEDFQLKPSGDGALFERVVEKATQWGTIENLMFVVGATRGIDIERVRKCVPNHFFLVPGVGAQGGSLSEIVKYGWIDDCGLLVNSSRGILYASKGRDFAEAAHEEAAQLQIEMSNYM